MIKVFMMLMGISAGSIIAAGQAAVNVGDEGANYIQQYGALGILGLLAVYVVTKLVPQAIESRRKESQAFLLTLTSEREKLVESMEKMTESHSDVIREINTTSKEEHRAWARVLEENTKELQEVREAIRNGK